MTMPAPLYLIITDWMLFLMPTNSVKH